MNGIPQKTLIPTDTGHPQAASGNSCCKALQEAAMVTDEEMRNPSFWMRARATARRLLGLPPYLFSLSLQSCFETARSLAKNTDNRTCTHWHMLLALSQSKDGIAAQLLRAFPLHDEAAVEEMQSHIGPTSETSRHMPEFSRTFKIMLALAGREANRMGDFYVGTYHVLIALTLRDDLCQQFLKRYGIDRESLTRAGQEALVHGPLID